MRASLTDYDRAFLGPFDTLRCAANLCISSPIKPPSYRVYTTRPQSQPFACSITGPCLFLFFSSSLPAILPFSVRPPCVPKVPVKPHSTPVARLISHFPVTSPHGCRNLKSTSDNCRNRLGVHNGDRSYFASSNLLVNGPCEKGNDCI